MKRNLLQVAGAVALSLTVAFAGCTRGEGDASSAPRTVLLKVALPEVATRADDASSLSGTEPFQPGWLFFTNAGGTITRALQITSTGNYQATTPDANEVGVGQLTGGVQILNVPGPSTVVHVISNLPSGVGTGWNAATAVGENITVYTGAGITVESQYDATNGDGSKVTLYGYGNITVVMLPDLFSASVALDPVAGRLEIAKISADVSEIVSFKVTGVFVNQYYASLPVNGTVASGVLPVDNLSTVGNYALNAGTYLVASHHVFFDVDDYSSTGTPPAATPLVSTKVWAYNLLAPALAGYFPHVVIKITNIDVVDDATNGAYENGTWYLTIANVQVNGTGAYLPFLKGNIYRLEDVAFTLSDLGSVPELTTKKVTVAVSVTAWAPQTVTPVLQ
jgi:hypothetical protein